MAGLSFQRTFCWAYNSWMTAFSFNIEAVVSLFSGLHSTCQSCLWASTRDEVLEGFSLPLRAGGLSAWATRFVCLCVCVVVSLLGTYGASWVCWCEVCIKL